DDPICCLVSVTLGAVCDTQRTTTTTPTRSQRRLARTRSTPISPTRIHNPAPRRAPQGGVMRRTTMTMLGAGAALALALTACAGEGAGSGGADDDGGGAGNGAETDPEDRTAGVAMPTQTYERWLNDGAAVEEGLEAQGYTVDLQF